MIRGAIFDVDGTLLDSMGEWKAIGERYLKSLGLTPKEDLWEAFKPLTLDQAARYYQSHYGVSLSVEEIEEGINALIEEVYFVRAQLRPGVESLLAELKRMGVRMVIATATDRYLVEAALKRCGILHYFETIITCREAGSKRQPGIYETALSALGTEKKDTWVFEDALHGARTAAEAGFPVLGIRDPTEEEQQALQAVSAVYLTDFTDPEPFWRAISL